MLIEVLAATAILLVFVYKWLTKNFDHFEKLGIRYMKPALFMGSFTGFVFKRESLREELLRKYQEFKNDKLFGVFEGTQPKLVINDLEVMKKITVKDFESFKNHDLFIDPEDDALFGNSVLAMKDEKWHDMRITLSPAFTGSKMRLMFKLILEICQRATNHLEKDVKNKPNSGNGIDIEMKDFYLMFTNDAIASTAFGLEVNSFEDKDTEFLRMGKKIITFSSIDAIKFTLYNSFKPLFRLLGVSFREESFNKYFHRLVIDAMHYRKEHNIVRQDMINNLLEARNNPEKTREWLDEELVAQCFIFFFAGLESVSTTLCFATQELVENPDVQEKLREEVDSVVKELNGEPLTYEVLQKMKYMDMFMSEALRLWPPFIQTDRVCTKPYKIETDDITIDLKVGEVIWLPMICMHLNEKYFADPLKFDPERFSDENKSNIQPMSYAPFGFGPRLCIASRLALMECKAILFNIIANYELAPSAKTNIPVKLAPTNFPVSSKNGFWLKMIPRK